MIIDEQKLAELRRIYADGISQGEMVLDDYFGTIEALWKEKADLARLNKDLRDREFALESKIAGLENDFSRISTNAVNLELRVFKLEDVRRAASEFLAQLPCYVQGLSVLAEEDVKPLHDKLILSLDVLKENP